MIKTTAIKNELNKLHSLIPGGIVARLGELGTDAQRKQQKERIKKMLNFNFLEY